MALEAASLYAVLGLDSSAYRKGLGEAKGELSDFGGILGGVGKVAGGILVSGLALGAGAVVGLSAALGDFVGEAMAAEDVQAGLNAVMKSTHGIAGVTTDAANGLADALSSVTRFDDEAIISGESLLLTFTNIGKDIFPQATETMLDMSQALGQDMKSSAVQLGKALQDPILGVTALRRVGVNFTDAQQAQIKSLVESGHALEAQKLILAELQTEFGGAARAAGATFGGQLDILNTKIGNAKETIGGALLPILSDLADKYLPPLIKFVTDAADQFAAWAPTLKTVVDALLQGNVAISTGQPILDEFLKFWQGLGPILTDFAAKMSTTLPPALESMSGSLSRMGVALGLTNKDISGADIALGLIKGTLDAVVIGVQLATVTMDKLASAVETVTKFVNDGVEGWKRFADAAQGASKFFYQGNPAPGIAAQSGATGAGIGAGNLGAATGGRTFDTGGIIPGPIGSRQMVAAQGGEIILPIGGSQTINLVVDGQVLARVVTSHQNQAGLQRARMGGAAAL